jgi:hypothetical protein
LLSPVAAWKFLLIAAMNTCCCFFRLWRHVVLCVVADVSGNVFAVGLQCWNHKAEGKNVIKLYTGTLGCQLKFSLPQFTHKMEISFVPSPCFFSPILRNPVKYLSFVIGGGLNVSWIHLHEFNRMGRNKSDSSGPRYSRQFKGFCKHFNVLSVSKNVWYYMSSWETARFWRTVG